MILKSEEEQIQNKIIQKFTILKDYFKEINKHYIK